MIMNCPRLKLVLSYYCVISTLSLILDLHV